MIATCPTCGQGYAFSEETPLDNDSMILCSTKCEKFFLVLPNLRSFNRPTETY